MRSNNRLTQAWPSAPVFPRDKRETRLRGDHAQAKGLSVMRTRRIGGAQEPQAQYSASPAPSHVRGAPGPLAGAGLPFLVVGYGVYWLIKRRRKAD